ncbi:hypothetical protein LUZ60_008515 [Juncus effusus]|nr:hypothetical protein LUZ60_008515 [Juncus effusus]
MDSVLLETSPMATHPFSVASQTLPNLQLIVNDSIDQFLIAIKSESRDLSPFKSIFSRILQSTIDPPLEIVWLYSAVCFHESVSYRNDCVAVVNSVKDLLSLLSTCSANCNGVKSIALLAPAVSELYYCYLNSKDLSSKEGKKVRREIECLIERILGYISICSGKISIVRDKDLLLPGFKDLVRVWTAKHKNGENGVKVLFPLVNGEIRDGFERDECQIGYLAGVVIAEAFLLKLSLRVSGNGGSSSKKELQMELGMSCISSICVFQNLVFFDALLSLLLEAPLPVLSLIDKSEEILVRDILYDALIRSEYSFVNHAIAMNHSEDYLISIFIKRLIVTHQAVLSARNGGDQNRAISYITAFSSSSVPNCLIKWVNNHTVFGTINKPNSSTPQALLKWLVELEDNGIKLFGDKISKFRNNLIFDEPKIPNSNFNSISKQTDEELFFVDKKGSSKNDDVMMMMDDAFMAAAESMRDGKNRKRKEFEEMEGQKAKLGKFGDGFVNVSSGSEVDDPESDGDDEMDGSD